MQALNYIEIDLPFCSLTYGVAPCEASLTSSPPTGTIKCFNSIATCQDRANFTEETVTLRFTEPSSYLPREIDAIPSIHKIEMSASKISLGEDLGQRATLEVEFKDHKHADTVLGFDKYVAERLYDSYEQGTFWGKFRARQPYLRGRALRWVRGEVGQALADMEVRHFFIESFDGPGHDGRVKLIAKDALKFADGDRAQAPRLSNGFLLADISAGANDFTLSPAGIGDAEYPADGRVNIGGKEICTFQRTGDFMAIGRADSNTVAVAHSAQDRAQVCLRYLSVDPAEIIADLLTTYAGVDAGLIPTAAWLQETETYLGRVYTALIAEPTPVNKLISELVEQAALSLWWDDLDSLIRLQVLRGVDTSAVLYDETNVIAGSIKVHEQPEKRISRVSFYFAQINPLKRIEDLDNYRSTAGTIDADNEADYGGAAIKNIFSRWVPALGRAVASRANDIQIGRFRHPPRRVEFDVFRTSPNVPELGGGYRFSAFPLQDATGELVELPGQAIRVGVKDDRYSVEIEEVQFNVPEVDLTNRVLIVDANINNINFRTSHDALYPEPVSGDTVTLIVNAGVIVGSASPASPALSVGTWPAGVILVVQLNGRVQGAGGRGGPGSTHFTIEGAALNGEPGGLALYAGFDVEIQFGAGGQIWGGGGGGGGGGGVWLPVDNIFYEGGGGGGGTGKEAGDGGFGNVAPGQPGTSAGPGAGGIPAQQPKAGGIGGGPGAAGAAGEEGATLGGPARAPGQGGAAGTAIDGVSFVTTAGTTDIRGAQIN